MNCKRGLSRTSFVLSTEDDAQVRSPSNTMMILPCKLSYHIVLVLIIRSLKWLTPPVAQQGLATERSDTLGLCFRVGRRPLKPVPLGARLESRSGELKRDLKKRPFPVSVQTDVRLGMFTQ
jgi:hypothetical protein